MTGRGKIKGQNWIMNSDIILDIVIDKLWFVRVWTRLITVNAIVINRLEFINYFK